MSAPFEPGERALLLDDRGRRYLIRLQPGSTFHFHGGMVPHDLILREEEGVTARSTGGIPLVAFRPTMADFILKMPRGAQVVYPKDIGAILVHADVGPGTSVIRVVTPAGMERSTAAESYRVDLSSGQTAPGFTFGYFRRATLSGKRRG